MSKQCRWGILGTAGIAQKNWASIKNSGNGTLIAVASRKPARAREFIDGLQRVCPFGTVPAGCDYEGLLARDDIDAVYIPLPTGLRAEWVIKAAQAGKHVLCEKPCAIHASQLREMLDACREHGVQFMDGVMYMHSARMQALREMLDDGHSIGQVKRMVGNFSFLAPDEFFQANIRSSSDLEPQGALGDLGWYLLRFALWIKNFEMPVEVRAQLLAEHCASPKTAAVPTEVSGELLFAGGFSAGFYCSFLTEHQQFVHVSGTRGNLLVDDFVLPYFGNEVAFEVSNADFQISGPVFNMERHTRRVSVREYSNNTSTSQETKMFRHFSQRVIDKRLDSFWPEASLKTQILLDACFESMQQSGRPVTISA